MKLAKRLRDRWATRGELEVRCAGGRFPELGFLIEARWSRGHRVGIVGLDREREIIPFLELVVDRSVRPIVRELVVADLDGNGIDEVVDVWRREQSGGSGDQLILWTTEGIGLERIDGPNLNAFRSGLGSCKAQVEVGGRAVAISVRTLHGLAPTECLPTGRHRFVMRDGRLVQLGRPRDAPSVLSSSFDGAGS